MCRKRLVVNKVTFPNAIAVEESTDSPSPFLRDQSSLVNLKTALANLDPTQQYLSATFVGLFETRNSLEDLVAGHGLTNGYGLSGQEPGRLIPREIKEISVEPKPPAPSVLSICALLMDPLTFNGKLVAVKGILRTYQGWWLYDDQCPSHITVEGLQFENTIAVIRPTDPARIHDVQFDTDEDSLAGVRKAFGEDSTIHPRVSATIVGVLETRAGLKLVSPVGSPWGFGHLGAAPAQLLLKECREVTAEYLPLRY
jgi:hypothetical protein